MKVNEVKYSEEETIEIAAKCYLEELHDLWILTGIGSGPNGGMDWEYRARVFEEMIVQLSPRHAKYKEIK